MAEPLACGLFRAAERSAWHMELRDVYVPDDPDWLDWQATAAPAPPGNFMGGPTTPRTLSRIS